MILRNSIRKVILASSAALVFAASPAWSQQDLEAQARASQEQAAATPPSPFMAVSEVDPGNEKVQEFLEQRGWAMGESANNPGGGTLVVGTESISVDPTSIDFSQARILATEEAFLKAMGELVSQDAVNIGKSMVDRFMKDDLPEDVKDTTNLQAFAEAVSSRLAEASVQGLNKIINELGGDTSKLPELNIAERKQLIYDEFVTDTTWRAMGQLSGVGVFGVIEEVGGTGPMNNGRVSVVVVKADRFSEFGRQLRTGDVAPGQAIPVEEIRQRLDSQIKAKEPMLGYFGVQPVVDKQGRYGLLSFGMAGPELVRGTMDEFDISAELEASKETAKLMADGWLAQFATMTVDGEKQSTKRKLRQKVRETRGDGSSEIKTAQGVGRMVNNVLRSESNARLQGVQTIAEWDAVDPSTGHPYLGFVKYWSPLTSAKAQGKLQPAAKQSASGSKPSTAVQRSSRSTGSFGEW